MDRSSSGQSLSSAKKARQDEFYTQLDDICSELGHYGAQLCGKTIFCNCDDPRESNFFKYFALNFNALGIKKLIAAGRGEPATLGVLGAGGSGPERKWPCAIEIREVPGQNGGAADVADVDYLLRRNANAAHALEGDGRYCGGDFRSSECIEFLKEADIVITNPPFSLFREYIAQLVRHEKRFLIIGNKNAITYKEVYSLIKDNRVWVGATPMGADLLFDVSAASAKAMLAEGKEGSRYRIVDGIVKGRSPSIWFTNMDNHKRRKEIPLYKKYSPADYPHYDNYDAIDVGRVAEIPMDYDGTVGVPITFLDKYNPRQFEIVKFRKGNDERDLVVNGKYPYFRILIKQRGAAQ